MRQILDQEERDGAVMVGDFENDRTEASSGWWDWRPAKVALEKLYLEGKLMVSRDRKIHRPYDVAMNLVTNEIDLSMPSPEEFARFTIKRTLGALMKLILAEAASKSNNLLLALDHLNDIRKFRTAAADYLPVHSSDREAVLERVLLKRRFELAFKGMRWFDMRRLDAKDRMPTVRRSSANGQVIATLEKHSTKYVLKIRSRGTTLNTL